MAGGRWQNCAAWALLFALACSSEPNLAPGIAAKIKGREIPYLDFTQFLEDAAGDTSALQSVAISSLFESFLDEELLFSLALDRNLLTEAADRRVAASVLLSSLDGLVPSEAEIQQYYREHIDEFTAAERIQISQILVQDKALADQAWRELESGEAWGAVASRLEQEHGAVVGSQGELSRAEMPAAFVDAVFALSPGEYTPVLKAEYGYHVFLVEGRRPAGTMPLEEVRSEIERTITTQRSDQALQRLLAEAKERYTVQVADRNLPFERSEP